MVIVQISYGYTGIRAGRVGSINITGGAIFFSKKVDDFFSRRPQNTRYKTTTLPLSRSPQCPQKLNSCCASGGALSAWDGALKTFPCKFDPPPKKKKFFLRPGGARAPSAPTGYAYARCVRRAIRYANLGLSGRTGEILIKNFVGAQLPLPSFSCLPSSSMSFFLYFHISRPRLRSA